MKTNAIVIAAPSGAGKSTIVHALLQEESTFSFSISTTTRQRRSGEEHGRDYYFIREDEFKKLIDKDHFLEWAQVHGNYYGTLKNEIDRINKEQKVAILDIDVQGAESVKKVLPAALFIFIIPPDFDELKRRLVDRGANSEEEIVLRLGNARNELRRYGIFDYIVVNDDLDRAVDDVMSIIKAYGLRLAVQEQTITQLLENFDDHSNG